MKILIHRSSCWWFSDQWPRIRNHGGGDTRVWRGDLMMGTLFRLFGNCYQLDQCSRWITYGWELIDRIQCWRGGRGTKLLLASFWDLNSYTTAGTTKHWHRGGHSTKALMQVQILCFKRVAMPVSSVPKWGQPTAEKVFFFTVIGRCDRQTGRRATVWIKEWDTYNIWWITSMTSASS